MGFVALDNKTFCSRHQHKLTPYLLFKPLPHNRNVNTGCITVAKGKSTATAILPIYNDGKRGCFFDAGVNKSLTGDLLGFKIGECRGMGIGAVVFGYPHLLPGVQKNGGIEGVLRKAKEIMEDGGITVMDLNGVGQGEGKGVDVIGEALGDGIVDILHCNEDELKVLVGREGTTGLSETIEDAKEFVKKWNVAILAVTRGANECVVCCADKERFKTTPCLPEVWKGMVGIGKKIAGNKGEGAINANGGGDAWTAGFLCAAMMRKVNLKKTGKKGPKKKQKKKRSRGPPANAFTLFAKGFFEDLVAKATAAGMNPQDEEVRRKLVLQCDRNWAALGKEEKRRFSGERDEGGDCNMDILTPILFILLLNSVGG